MDTTDRTPRTLDHLIPRERFTFCHDRSTNNKRHCFDCASRSEPGVTRHQAHDLAADTWWCSCPGFAYHGRCAHTDSLRYWRAYRAATARLAREGTAWLADRSDRLLAALAAGGLRLDEHAELDACGEIIAARMARAA